MPLGIVAGPYPFVASTPALQFELPLGLYECPVTTFPLRLNLISYSFYVKALKNVWARETLLSNFIEVIYYDLCL